MSLISDMVRYRAKKNYSQKELAKACGLSLQTINSVENGIQTPSKLTEQKIRLVIDKEDE